MYQTEHHREVLRLHGDGVFQGSLQKKEKYSSYRFDFCGYDGTLWCEPREDGDMVAGFMKEYRNTGNGYYYLLINDNTMIGYDID